MRNLALLCAGLAIVLGVVSVRLWQELGAERQLTAQLRAQLAEQGPAAAPPVRERGMAVAADAPPADAPPLRFGDAPAAPAAATDGPAAQQARVVRLDSSELLKDPEYRAAMRAQVRSRMWQMYPGLAEALGLAPADAERLLDALADAEVERSAAPAVLRSNGQLDPAALEELRRRQDEHTRRQDEVLAAILGPEGPARFREYEGTRGARTEVASVAQALQARQAPLDEAQSRALTDIFIAEVQRQQQESREMVQRFAAQASPEDALRVQEASLDLAAERNRRILEAARGHLTAQQLQLLQEEFNHQVAMNRATMRMLLQQRELQGAAMPGPVVALPSPGLASGGAVAVAVGP